MPGLITKGLGAGGAGVDLLSTTISIKQISLNFSDAPSLVGDALSLSKWSISGVNSVSILSISISTNSIILITSEMSNGGSYLLNIPQYITSTGGPWVGPYSQTFTGVGATPVIVYSKVIDARHLEICFSEPVNKYDALNIANYSISGLVVVGVEQISDSIFRIQTSHQTVGTSYSIVASNIRDRDNISV